AGAVGRGAAARRSPRGTDRAVRAGPGRRPRRLAARRPGPRLRPWGAGGGIRTHTDVLLRDAPPPLGYAGRSVRSPGRGARRGPRIGAPAGALGPPPRGRAPESGPGAATLCGR